MDPKQLRVTLGLAEDASDADVTAAIAAGQEARKAASGNDEGGNGGEGGGEGAPAPDPAPEGEPAPAAAAASAAVIPEGFTMVDKEALAQIQAGAARGTELWAATQKKERDDTIMAAVGEGKFGRARVEHYAKAWDADPEGTKSLIASLAPGLVPVEEVGSQGGPEGEGGGDAYPMEWLSPQERRVVEAAAAGSTPGAGTITNERVGT